MATLTVFLGIAAWEYYLQRHGKSKGWLFTGLLVIAASLLLSTAWHGGELPVQAEDMPREDGHEHGHDDAGNGAGVPPRKAGHPHAPGTPPHND